MDDADSPKNTAIRMIFQAAAADGAGAASPAAVSGGDAQRTFANSNFKREYEESCIVPITKAAQVIGKISEFIHVYCHVHELTSEIQKVAAETFVDRLQKEAVCPNHFSC